MELIDKDALVEEIKRRRDVHFTDYHINKNGRPADYGACNALCQILSFIDTLEVKEEFKEYILADAFIEKAASWIENNLSKYAELTDKDEYGNKLKEPVMNVFYGQAVKDFINYMKGE